jgi:hypothetical protein
MTRKILAWFTASVALLCYASFVKAGDTNGASEEDMPLLFAARNRTVFPTPPTDGLDDDFTISPDGHRLAFVKHSPLRNHLYTADFPVRDASMYHKITDVPNVQDSSSIAWCREEPTKLAFAAHFVAGAEIPECADILDYKQWSTKADLRKRRPGGRPSDVQKDKRIERRIAIVSTSDGSVTKSIETPIAEGVSDLGSLCWPTRDTIFYLYGNSIFRVDLGTTPPEVSRIYALSDKNAVIVCLGFDSVNNLLHCFRITSHRSGQEVTNDCEVLSFSGDNKLVKTSGTIPLWSSLVCSNDGSRYLGIANAPLHPGENVIYFGDFASGKWTKVPMAADTVVPTGMQLQAFDSERNLMIARVWQKGTPYFQWSLNEKQGR